LITTGLVYNIQRFSLYDGPGIRTVVFFQGCNLRCLWCHNPESISMNRQLMYHPEKCIGCGVCVEICSQHAHSMDSAGAHTLDRNLCMLKFDCVDSCYAEALTVVGKEVDTEYVMQAILTDLPYYVKSGGGVTFSGGESMLQIDFLEGILTKCRENGIHTAVDTAGNVPWSAFVKIADVTDLFLFDVKAADNETHKKLTNAPNRRILSNLKRLAGTVNKIHIRIPFVPGGNDDEIESIADFIAPLDVEAVQLLPYHQMGLAKVESIRRGGAREVFEVPEKESIERALKSLRSRNIPATTMTEQD
jgi:choline trimethylamine-lyase activating enzyme